MTATEILKNEHKVILMVIEVGEREIRAIIPTGRIATDNLEKIIDFCRVFIESCHNAKEEEYLLPKMQERGEVGNRGLIKTILEEHAEGRHLQQLIIQALPQAKACAFPSCVAAVTANLKAYRDLLRAHIEKEDNTLFPLADMLLTPEDQKAIMVSFEKHETEEVGVGVHGKYLQLAHELAQSYSLISLD
jgi:hemerythrin-like domain-containing protein